MAKNQEVTPAPEVPVPKPATPEVRVKKAKPSRQFAGNAIAFLVAVAVLGYLIFATWQGYIAVDVPTVTAVTNSIPALPQLKLNQNNQRQGPTINVNTNDIGKDNPFSR